MPCRRRTESRTNRTFRRFGGWGLPSEAGVTGAVIIDESDLALNDSKMVDRPAGRNQLCRSRIAASCLFQNLMQTLAIANSPGLQRQPERRSAYPTWGQFCSVESSDWRRAKRTRSNGRIGRFVSTWTLWRWGVGKRGRIRRTPRVREARHWATRPVVNNGGACCRAYCTRAFRSRDRVTAGNRRDGTATWRHTIIALTIRRFARWRSLGRSLGRQWHGAMADDGQEAHGGVHEELQGRQTSTGW